jgi:hypothetical protein
MRKVSEVEHQLPFTCTQGGTACVHWWVVVIREAGGSCRNDMKQLFLSLIIGGNFAIVRDPSRTDGA